MLGRRGNRRLVSLLPGELPPPWAISTDGAGCASHLGALGGFWGRAGFVSIKEKEEGTTGGKDHRSG